MRSVVVRRENYFEYEVLRDRFDGGTIDGLPEARYLGRLVQGLGVAQAGRAWRPDGQPLDVPDVPPGHALALTAPSSRGFKPRVGGGGCPYVRLCPIAGEVS
jgi:hypothetical protein